MRLTQNSRVYLLTLVAYLGAFTFGYDLGVAGGVLTMAGFQDQFHLTGTSKDHVTSITSHVVSVLQAGAFFGATFAAPLSEKSGRKWALIWVSIIFLVGASIQVAGTVNISWIYGGRFVAGLGVGAMTAIAPSYVAESAPAAVRGRITGFFQVVTVLGGAISYWIVYGVNVHFSESDLQWRIPIGFQIAPVGVMLILLFFCKESPRWLARHGREEESLKTLAWFRKLPMEDIGLQDEFTQILAVVMEERKTKGPLQQCLKKGNRIRFLIAFTIFLLQQWSGQNSVSYYAPQVFQAIGINSTNSSLFASGIYGIVKAEFNNAAGPNPFLTIPDSVATIIFLFVGIEQVGRRKSLAVGGFLMGVFFFILGAVYFTHTPNLDTPTPNFESLKPPSIVMAVMIYLYVIPYCFSWGPVPWVYCSEIFGNSIRSYGMAVAAATQWLFNFVQALVTPTIFANLTRGRAFFVFASINMGMAAYALLLPETKGVSLEDMDILFGSVTKESRRRDLQRVHDTLYGQVLEDRASLYPSYEKTLPLVQTPEPVYITTDTASIATTR